MSEENVPLKTYKDCIAVIICHPPQPACYLGDCKESVEADCISILKERLRSLMDANMVDTITYKQWLSVDRSTFETVTKSSDDFLDSFCEKLQILIRHSFIAKQQSLYQADLKSKLQPGQFLVKEQYELLNYGTIGTWVDDILYSIREDDDDDDDLEKEESDAPPNSLAHTVRKLLRSSERLRNNPFPRQMRGDPMETEYPKKYPPCECKVPFKRKKGYEGAAPLFHGSLIQFGCLKFVFARANIKRVNLNLSDDDDNGDDRVISVATAATSTQSFDGGGSSRNEDDSGGDNKEDGDDDDDKKEFIEDMDEDEYEDDDDEESIERSPSEHYSSDEFDVQQFN